MNGIPGLSNKISEATNVVALLKADVGIIMGFFLKQQWGIYKDGEQVIVPDAIVGIDFSKEWEISSAPQEDGAFRNYNKVETPFNAKVRLSKGGSIVDRNSFLTTIEDAAASLDLFDVITPERTYIKSNITHYNYTRTSTSGAGLITVDIALQEIRDSAETAFTKSKEASGADTKDGGCVQPITPSTTEQSSMPLRY